ncbi:MAG: hypothetical protein JW888_17860, partial [Pirellulales bacterium]|nr:hypothetical protein [Pirellulales bacterium]
GGMGGMRGGMNMGVGGQQSLAPYRLFRFFDFNVEPGRRYRYRVQIWVKNPNFDVPARYLVKELRDRMNDKDQWKKYLITEWSESNVISVPRDDRLLAVEVTPTRGIDREPVGTIMAIHWDCQKGDEIYDEFKVGRGLLANFLEQKIPEPKTDAALPGGHDLLGGPGEMGYGLGEGDLAEGNKKGPKKKKTPKPKVETIDYLTEMLVLDLRGGERLPGKNRDLTWPGEMLLLDPDGNLVVHSDVGDHKEYSAQKNPAKTQPGIMGGPTGTPGGLEGPTMRPGGHPMDMLPPAGNSKRGVRL